MALRLRYALLALIVAVGLAAGVLLTAVTAAPADACQCHAGWVYDHGQWRYISCPPGGPT